MLPTGLPWLLRLKRLLKLSGESQRVGPLHRRLHRWLAAALAGPARLARRRWSWLVHPAAALWFDGWAKLKTFATFRFTETKPGPRPKFRGMIVWPGDGFGSNAPSGVTTTPGLFRSVANAGRSLKNVSPFVSRPVVMLNGWPELAIMNSVQVEAVWRLVIPAAIHEAQRAKRRACPFATEIVSVERRAALAVIGVSCFVQVVAAPEIERLHVAVEVEAERVADRSARRLILENVSGIVAERAHAAVWLAGNKRAAERRVDVHDALLPVCAP